MDVLMMILTKFIPFAALTLLYILLKRQADRKVPQRGSFSDEEFLAGMAQKLKGSEYDVFHLCAKAWHISAEQVEDDFRAYLRQGSMPSYVRDYLRKHRHELLPKAYTELYPGGSLPTSWGA